MKTNLIQKLTSRKLWFAVAGIVIGIAMFFGVEGSEIEMIVAKLSGSATAISAILGYINGEAKVDAARENSMNLNFGAGQEEEEKFEG